MSDSRVSNLAANTLLNNTFLGIQDRLFESQLQVTTQIKSQDYKGIGIDTERLINTENTRDLLTRFNEDNQRQQTRLSLMSTTLEGARTEIKNFQTKLIDFQASSSLNRETVEDIQEDAIDALKSLEFYLNQSADGRFFFGGTRVQTAPVDFGVTTLSNFQSTFDGARVSIATTRDSHLENFSLNQTAAADTTWLQFEQDAGSGLSRVTSSGGTEFTGIAVGTIITISGTTNNNGTYKVAANNGGSLDIVTEQLTTEAAVASTVTFREPFSDPTAAATTVNATLAFTRGVGAANDTITVTPSTALDNLDVGASFTVSGTASNNGTYTVLSNAAGTITIEKNRFTDEGGVGTEVAGTVAASNYYSGDNNSFTHRVSADRSFDIDLNALDPAFEKAVRAMKLIAQGTFGSEGGLDNNQNRITEALFLLDSSLERTVEGTEPFGTELTSNFESVQIELGFEQRLIEDTIAFNNRFIGFLETSIAQVEVVDETEAITRLLDDQRALEISFQTLARVRQLTLSNFI